MVEEKNLLVDIIEETSNYQYNLAILTTFEFSLAFFEDQVMRALPEDTYLLIDATKYKEELKKVKPSSKYVNSFKNKIILVNFQEGVFHSKIFLFLGEDKKSSYLLSANMSKRGFTRNLELVSKFQDKNAIFEIFKELRGIVEKCSGKASEELLKRLSEFKKMELEPLSSDIKIFTNESDTIMNQFLSQIKGKKFKELYVSSPYLDNNPDDTIRNLDTIQVDKKFFIVQNKNEFTIDALKHYERVHYNFLLFNNIRFLHAKFLYLHNDKVGYLLNGSANLTKMAMRRTYKNGNCEICCFSEQPPDFFKTEYLRTLELNECTNIKELDFTSNGAKDHEKDKTPLIQESYMENKRLTIEVYGDFQDYIICVYNSENELVKTIELKDCDIEKNENYHIIRYKHEFKKGLYKLILIKDSLESNPSYFTTEKKEYSREDYIKQVLSEDRKETNNTILFDQALREYNEIVEHKSGTLGERLPLWKTKRRHSFNNIYKLLLRGLKRINEYFERIYNEELELKQNAFRIEKLIVWELEKILTLQRDDQDLKSKIDLLRKLNLTIVELEKIKDIDEIKEIIGLNLDYWNLSSLLVYFSYLENNKYDFFFRIGDIMGRYSPDLTKNTEELKHMLKNKTKKKFFPELIEKIEKDDYFSRDSIEIIRNIPDIINYLKSSGVDSVLKSPFALSEFNIIDNNTVKKEYRDTGSTFCPECEKFLLPGNIRFLPGILYCPGCNHYFNC